MEELLIVAACLSLNALLAAAEMAFVTVGRAPIRILAQRGSKPAKTLLELKNKPERILSVIQIGITFVGALAAAVSGVGAEESLSPGIERSLGVSEGVSEFIAIALVTIPLTYFNVVLGELVPKTISLKRPTQIALLAAPWLKVFDRALSPLITLLEMSTKIILRLLKSRPEPSVTDSDAVVDLGQLKTQTQQYVLNMINAEKKRASDVMIPWSDVNFVNKSDTRDAVEEVVLRSGHTRLPVVEGETVVGLLHTKEFMNLAKNPDIAWQDHLRPVLRFRDHEPILNILLRMQDSRSHLAIVYDRKDFIGVIALEDIVEEFVGDLYDEDDDGRISRLMAKTRTKKSATRVP